jgi:hypothetical protein
MGRPRESAASSSSPTYLSMAHRNSHLILKG